jgi:hypothetical protein
LKGGGRSSSLAARHLDRSGNEADHDFGSTFSFPPSIRKLVLNDTKFNVESFAATIKFCFEAPSLVSLGLNNIGLPGPEVARTFAQFLARLDVKESRFALQELHWDDNVVTPVFLRAPEKCPDLRPLSLNGSITGADRSIQLYREFLSVNTSV